MAKPAFSAALIFAILLTVLLTTVSLLALDSHAGEKEDPLSWSSLTMVYETYGPLVSVGSNPAIDTREVHRLEYRSNNDWKDTAIEATVVQYSFGEQSNVGSYRQAKHKEYTEFDVDTNSYREEEIGENVTMLAGSFMILHIPAAETTTALVCYWNGCAKESDSLRYHRTDAREMVSLGGRWAIPLRIGDGFVVRELIIHRDPSLTISNSFDQTDTDTPRIFFGKFSASIAWETDRDETLTQASEDQWTIHIKRHDGNIEKHELSSKPELCEDDENSEALRICVEGSLFIEVDLSVDGFLLITPPGEVVPVFPSDPEPLDGNDYDLNENSLIEVSNLAQLNAIRFDPDGDGESDNSGYSEAFPSAASGMGCPTYVGCYGYELISDLDFDTDSDSDVDSDDEYWNGGAGWEPIGSGGYTSWLSTSIYGNGYVISNLYINDPHNNVVGLFGRMTENAWVRAIGLESVDITGGDVVGGLVGINRSGNIYGSYVTGSVSGDDWVGGIAGANSGRISDSYATASVNGDGRVGGLVGSSWYIVEATYATGEVVGNNSVGGLVGENTDRIMSSYATGRVIATSSGGGLVGSSRGTVAGSYWDTDTSGQLGSAGGTGQTTANLQAPTGYEGIYAEWDSDGKDRWEFGVADEYPVLRGTFYWMAFGDQRP